MKRRIASLALALSLCLGLPLPAQAAQAGHFSDVPSTHWSYDYVEKAYADGAVSGMGSGRFAPDSSVTAAQFITMMVSAFYPELCDPIRYLYPDSWYGAPWAVAEQFGMLNYTSVSDPSAPLTRYDMAAILFNIVDDEGITSLLSLGDLQYAAGELKDFSSVPEQYQTQVAAVYALGILSGMGDGTFAGSQTMTRAQAAAVYCMIDRVFYDDEDDSGTSDSSASSGSQTAADSSLAAYQAEILRLVNIERAKEGVAPLALHETLCSAAQVRAGELPTLFSHTRPDGTQCYTAMDAVGLSSYRTAGENIAAGQSTPAEVVDAWMHSEGHRTNIMNPNFTYLGVGYLNTGSDYRYYWVQMFMG